MTVLELNNDLDQLSAEARGANADAEALIALAWWMTEEEIRNDTGACSMASAMERAGGHRTGIDARCQCCRYFADLSGRARWAKSRML
jgi:hypothetical protein